MNKQIDLAWAAGLFEGEGYIGYLPYSGDRGRRGYHHRSLILSMSDEDVVRRFHAIVGVGRVVEVAPRKANWSTQWRWMCTAWLDMRPLLESFLPFLGNRRGEAAARLLANPPMPMRGRRYANCKHGHPLSGNNLYVSPKGQRMCRTCCRRRTVEWRERQRAFTYADTVPPSFVGSNSVGRE